MFRPQTEDKIVKDGFYEKSECVFDKFPKYQVKILLGDFNAKVGRNDTDHTMTDQVCLLSDHSGQQIVILTTIWWCQE
jgi:hypothetical protein